MREREFLDRRSLRVAVYWLPLSFIAWPLVNRKGTCGIVTIASSRQPITLQIAHAPFASGMLPSEKRPGTVAPAGALFCWENRNFAPVGRSRSGRNYPCFRTQAMHSWAAQCTLSAISSSLRCPFFFCRDWFVWCAGASERASQMLAMCVTPMKFESDRERVTAAASFLRHGPVQ